MIEKDRNKIRIVNNISGSFMAGINSFDPDFESADALATKVAETISDSSFNKVANIFIDSPTEENIEDFIKKYIYNELSFFPRVLEVNVSVVPHSFNKNHENCVDDATGIVSIKVQHKNVELPFMISNGELNPFDVIQLDNQRVPFTRDNLKKIISNLDAAITNEKMGLSNNKNNSPYAGIDDYKTPATSPGFLSSALSIRDTNTRRYGKAGGHYVTASGNINLDKLLEKSASIQEITESQIDMITYCINKVAKEKVKEQFEKIAAEEDENILSRNERKALENKVVYTNITNFKSGDFIKFPYREANSISVLPGVVFKTGGVLKNDKKTNTIIVSTGNNYININRENFLCTRSNTQEFKLLIKTLNNLKIDEKFIISKDDKFSNIIKIYGIEDIYTAKNEKGERIFQRRGSFYDPERFDKFHLSSGGEQSLVLRILKCRFIGDGDIEQEKKLDCAIFKDFSIILAESDSANIIELKSLNDLPQILKKIYTIYPGKDIDDAIVKYLDKGKKEFFFVANPDTKIIPLKNKILGFFERQSEYERISQFHAAGYSDADIEKVAGEVNKIRVVCIDRKNGLFNIDFDYKDTTKRMFRLRRQSFKRISEGKLKVILRLLKYNQNLIKDIIYKAKNEPAASYPIPSNCTIDDINKIESGSTINLSVENTKKAINDIIGPDKLVNSIAVAIPVALGIDAIKSSVKNNPDGKISNMLKNPTIRGLFGMKKISKELSEKFEKYAGNLNSSDILDIAKVFTIEHNLLDKIAGSIEQNKLYPGIVSLSNDIVDAKPVIEKMAYDLMSLKINQQVENKDIINSIDIQAAIENLDNFYKIAAEINENIDINDINFLNI